MFELLTVPVRIIGGTLMACFKVDPSPDSASGCLGLPFDPSEDRHSRTRDWSVRPSHLIPLSEGQWNAGEDCGTLRLYVNEEDIANLGLKHRATVQGEQRQTFDAVMARLTPEERAALRAMKGEL